MSQRDGFAGGFLAGAIVGGLVGGIMGAVVASRRKTNLDEDNPSLLESGSEIKFNTEETIEVARRRLEDKIAQLNLAIDDVRQQLGPVDAHSMEHKTPLE